MTGPAERRSPALCRFFGFAMARAMRRDFHGVRLAGEGWPTLADDRPAIVYTNHPSWWDPAFLIVMASTRFRDRLSFGPIDAAMLQKYRFMARIGLFGVEQGSRAGAAAFLKTSLDLLDDPRTMLWITAEGRMTDPRARPVHLAPGLAHLVRRAPRAVVVPLALEYPFWDERTPEALARFGPLRPAEDLAGRDIGTIDADLTRALEHQMDLLAEDALARDSARFRTILDGTVGVGGIYDLYRRARAALTGRRFDPAHIARPPE